MFNHTQTRFASLTPFLLVSLLLVAAASSATAKSNKTKPVAETKRTRIHSEQPQSTRGKKLSVKTNANADKTTVAKRGRTQDEPSRRRNAEAERRAETRRRAQREREEAATRERARDEELRDQVKDMIANDDLAGEDPEVRRVAINALGNHAGTIVVMNPQTGRIYSIVNQQWAIREGFKPCSTIKLVTSVAGLSESVIDPSDTANVSDANNVSLTKALAYSKNGYFQQVGEQVGFEKMLAYARKLGLGEKTGINARNEFQGRLPSFASKDSILRMSSHGDNFRVTALQLATLVSAIGNGGNILTPRVVRSRQDEFRFRPKVRRRVNIDAITIQSMMPGLVGAVKYGSGKRAFDPAQTIAGKTGTCIEDGTWVGLFTSYAPVADPRLAVVVITRGADAGSHLPAAVAGRIYRELNGRFGNDTAVTSNRSVDHSTIDTEDNKLPAVDRLARSSDVKVKQVLMPIRRAEQTQKPVSANSYGAAADGQTRPRRVTVGS